MGKKRDRKQDAPQGARVLYDTLVAVERRSDLFFVCKKSGDHTICSAHTPDYIRAAVRELSALLNDYDIERGLPPPILEDIELDLVPEGVRWRALVAGRWTSLSVSNWRVAAKVRDFLNAQLPDGGITPIPCQKAGRGAH